MKRFIPIIVLISALIALGFCPQPKSLTLSDADTIAAAFGADVIKHSMVDLEADDFEASGTTVQLVAEIPHTDAAQIWSEVQTFQDDDGTFVNTSQTIWVGYDSSDARYALKYKTDTTAQTDEELDASETAITVDDSSLLTANEVILIESEFMSVSSIDDGTTITVVRGVLGSTAATHTTNQDIYELSTVFAFDLANKTKYSVPTENPEVILNDINNPGSDKYSVSIGAQYVDGADGSENNDVYIYANKGGSKTTIAKYDEDLDKWIFPASIIKAYEPRQIIVVEYTTDWATGDGAAYFQIDKKVAGMNLVDVHAECITAGTGTGTDTSDIQIYNLTQTADMLSTKLTIDEDETGSDTAATAAVIDTNNDDVAENDVIRVDIDAVTPTTDPKGLILILGFQEPAI